MRRRSLKSNLARQSYILRPQRRGKVIVPVIQEGSEVQKLGPGQCPILQGVSLRAKQCDRYIVNHDTQVGPGLEELGEMEPREADRVRVLQPQLAVPLPVGIDIRKWKVRRMLDERCLEEVIPVHTVKASASVPRRGQQVAAEGSQSLHLPDVEAPCRELPGLDHRLTQRGGGGGEEAEIIRHADGALE